MIGSAWARFRSGRGAMAGLVALVLLVALSLAAPAIAPQNPSDPLGFDPLAANHPPSLSWTYLLGADGRGRSVLALLLWGGRVSLAVGAGAALLAGLAGVLLGALAGGRARLVDPVIARLMDLCQAVPPLLVLLLFAGQMNGVPVPLVLVAFALTGWVAPARLTRAAVAAGLRAPYIEAARAAGVGTLRIVLVHLLPAILAPVSAWVAAGAATYVALEAGLDFLGLGLPQGTTSWGTALAGAQDALAAGNWWWMTFGGLALAAATLALGAIARGVAHAFDPSTVVVSTPHAALQRGDASAEAPLPALGEIWRSHPERRPGRPGSFSSRRAARLAAVAGAGLVLIAAVAGVSAGMAGHGDAQHLPQVSLLLREARDYPRHTAQRFAYIATTSYVASRALLGGRQIAWAARAVCPSDLGSSACAQSTGSVWSSGGQARILTEGITFVCTPRLTWGVNPMAGVALTERRGCGPLGPALQGLGATAGMVDAFLPGLDAAAPRLLGRDVVAGRPCWVIALPPHGQVWIDAETGLALQIERLDRHGEPVARFTVTAISYGLDLAPVLFANPIPGGHGPLINGLTQPLLTVQAADDVALFSALVPTFIPTGLVAQIPTYDSFYDQTRGYAPQDRVRAAYMDRLGRVVLVLIETVPGSAWDVTPPRSLARQVRVAGRRLLIWSAAPGAQRLVRLELQGTAALVSSPTLSLRTLEQVAVGLQ